jgi:hypothetical protein
MLSNSAQTKHGAVLSVQCRDSAGSTASGCINTGVAGPNPFLGTDFLCFCITLGRLGSETAHLNII